MRSIAVSLFFHAILILAFVIMAKPSIYRQPDEDIIELEIVPAVQPATPLAKTLTEPSIVSPLLRPDAFQPAPSAMPPASYGQTVPAEPAMQKPAKMLSAGVLADPRSRSAREALPTLAKGERLEQICGVEAMAQIAAWDKTYQPDRTIAYAMGKTRLKDDTLFADGAAFRSKHKWYNLTFKCRISSDSEKVYAFEFLVGEPIPPEEWEAHNLAPIY